MKILVDNLQQAAVDLYDYLKNPHSKENLMADVEEMKNNYQNPLDSWIYGRFYQYFRTRINDITLMKNKLMETNDPDEVVNCMMDFFQKGAWESTSANTLLMAKCFKNMPAYAGQDIERLLLDKIIIARLPILFMKHANKQQEDQQKKMERENGWLAKQKQERLMQLNDISWPKVDAMQKKIINCISMIKPKIDKPDGVHKLSQHEEYNRISSVLEASFFQQKEKKPSLLQILKYEFRTKETKKFCCQLVHDLLARGLITRAFDQFEFSIISLQEEADLSKQFIDLLPTMKVDNMEIMEAQDKAVIMQWEMRIIDMACHYLLDASGQIKQEILALLECKTPFTSQEIVGLICAYVGKVNLQIMSASKNLIDQYPDTFIGFCNVVSKKYGDWAVGKLKTLGHLTEDERKEQAAYTSIGVGAWQALRPRWLGAS